MVLLLVVSACRPGALVSPLAPGSPPPADTAAWDTGADTAAWDTSSGDTGEAWAEALDAVRVAVERDLRRAEASGAQVAISYRGEILMSEGFGSAHPDRDQPVLTTTLFQIGSDTKKLTAVTLLQRVQAGALTLDDTLATALPDLVFANDPSWSDGITLHHLLSHQSTLYDYTPWVAAADDADLAVRTYDTLAASEYAWAPGGTYWNYSNTNFSLAGLAVEEATGRPWPDVLSEDVLAPLGMERSFVRLADVVADGDAASGTGLSFPDGYETFDPFYEFAWDYGTVEIADHLDCGYVRPAGLVWSTAEDQLRIADFLIHGNPAVLGDDLRAAMATAHVPLYPTYPGQSYGYGLIVLDGFYLGPDWYEVPLWVHGGNTMTQTSTFYVLPEQDFAISILSNGYHDDMKDSVVAAISAIVELPEPGEAPGVSMAADLSEYAGTWYDPWLLGEVTIAWDGTDLTIAIPAFESRGIEVRAVLDEAFEDAFTATIDGYAYDLTFVDGDVPHQYLRNRMFGATRTDAPSGSLPPPRWASVGATPRLPPSLPLLPALARPQVR